MLRHRWIVLLLAGLLIGGGALVALSVAWIGPEVTHLLERQLPGSLVVRSWSLQLRPTVTVVARGVEFRSAPAPSSWNPRFRAERVEFQLDGIRLLLGQLRIARIGLESPELTLEAQDRDSHVEPQARAQGRHEDARGESGVRPPRLVTADPLPLEIRQGRLTFRGGNESKAITGVGGRLTYSPALDRLDYDLVWSYGKTAQLRVSGHLTGLRTDPSKLLARVETGELVFPGHAPVEGLRGEIRWTPRGAEDVALTARWGSARLAARFKAGWGPSSPWLRGEFSASTIDLAPFIRQIAEGFRDRQAPSSRTAGLVSSAHAEPSLAAWLPWARQIGVDLRLRVASARLNGEPLGALHAQLIADAGLWHLQGIRLSLDEGEPSGYVRLDLRHPRPHVTLFAQGPGLALFREGLPEPYRLVGGHLTFETLLQWEGLSWREFRKSMRGQGEFRIQDGRVATAQLIRHVEIQGIPRSGWEKKPDLAFDELLARYRFSGPRVLAQTLALSGPEWEIRGEGVLDLSGHLDLRLTGRAPRIQRLTGFLSGDVTHPRLVVSP